MKKTNYMGDSWRNGFYYFLVDNYVVDDDAAGELTRAAMEDKHFPRKSHSRDYIRSYLEDNDYDQAQIDVLDELFDSYIAELYKMAEEDEE